MSSWEADKALVRGSSELNLAIGEPYFLRTLFQDYYPTHLPSSLDMSYPDPFKTLPALQAELEKLHPGKHIVVTLGAKQALHAAVHALNHKREYVRLFHRAPYWPTYPTIAKYGNLVFTSRPEDEYGPHLISCNTSPNNPDGVVLPTVTDIFDAAYAHSVYGFDSRLAPLAKIEVWSGGKMLGSPGVRVGWLVTEVEEFAQRASQYIEQTTSGVPITSQYHVAETLRLSEPHRERLYKRGAEVLKNNREYLSDALGNRANMAGEAAGMFAWVEFNDPDKLNQALDKTGVLIVDGKLCGKAGYHRISLGKNTQSFCKIVDTLVAAM